jgi:hypothetical protein
VGCQGLLVQNIGSYPPYPQPEYAPCLPDIESLSIGLINVINKFSNYRLVILASFFI